jgi:hypothetical protein
MDLYKFGSRAGLLASVTGLISVLLLTHGAHLAGVSFLVVCAVCASCSLTLFAVGQRWLR